MHAWDTRGAFDWAHIIRIRRTPPFSDDAFDWAQLNSDESSELIHLIRKNYG